MSLETRRIVLLPGFRGFVSGVSHSYFLLQTQLTRNSSRLFMPVLGSGSPLKWKPMMVELYSPPISKQEAVTLTSRIWLLGGRTGPLVLTKLWQIFSLPYRTIIMASGKSPRWLDPLLWVRGIVSYIFRLINSFHWQVTKKPDEDYPIAIEASTVSA